MQLPNEVHLISANYVKEVTQLNGAVDDNYIRPFITTAQDLHLENYLGSSLTRWLKTNMATIEDAGNELYLELYQKHITKVLAWWTMVEVLPHLYVKVDNGNLVLRTSEDTTPITQTDLTRTIENARQKAQSYTQRMVDWLCFNRIDEYYDNTDEDKRPQRVISRVNGMVRGKISKLPEWQRPDR